MSQNMPPSDINDGGGGGRDGGSFRWTLSFVCFMLLLLAGTITQPVMVSVQTSVLERITDCASDKPGVLKCAPRAANYFTVANAVSAFFTFLISPYYGGLSDRWGRKFFLCISMLGYYSPNVFLLGSPSSLLPFYVTTGLVGLLPSPPMIVFSMIADMVPRGRRLDSFARFLAIVMIAAAVGNALNVKLIMVLGDQGVLKAAGIASAISFVLLPIFLPETLGSIKGDDEASPRIARKRSVAEMLAPFDATVEEQWYRWFYWLVILSAVPQAGLGTIVGFFVKERYGLTSAMFSLQFAVALASGCFWQSGGLTLLMRYCPNQGRVFQVACAFNLVHFLPYIFITAQWAPFGAGSLAGASFLQNVVLRSIASDLTDASSQGRVSGILDACNGLSNVVGPILIGQVYSLGSLLGVPQLAFLLVAFGLLPLSIFLASFIVLPATIPASLLINSQQMAKAKNLEASKKPLLS